MNFNDMKNFLETEMEMQYNYQPVMILSLLKCPNCTAPKTLLEEQLWRYNRFSSKKYREPLQEAIQATSETKNRNIVSVLDGDKIKLNLDEDDQDTKNKLIAICYEKIAEWDSENTVSEEGKKERIGDDTRFFLLLPNELGSSQLLENSYTHVGWSDPGDQKPKKYGEVKIGDIILVYFAAKSVTHAMLLKTAYKVVDVSKNHETLDLKPVKALFGIPYQKIKELRESGELGEKFNPIGYPLNFTEISRQDYRDALFVDSKLKPSMDEGTFLTANSAVKKIMEEHE